MDIQIGLFSITLVENTNLKMLTW